MTRIQISRPLNILSPSRVFLLGLTILTASVSGANAQLPPGAPHLPGVVAPQVTPPALAPNGLPNGAAAQAAPSALPVTSLPAAAPTGAPTPEGQTQAGQTQATNVPGQMVLGEKIDVLTLSDLEDKLQASPNMILLSASRDYQMQLLKSLNEKIAAVGMVSFDKTSPATDTMPKQ